MELWYLEAFSIYAKDKMKITRRRESVIETHSLILLVGFGLFNFDATRA